LKPDNPDKFDEYAKEPKHYAKFAPKHIGKKKIVKASVGTELEDLEKSHPELFKPMIIVSEEDFSAKVTFRLATDEKGNVILGLIVYKFVITATFEGLRKMYKRGLKALKELSDKIKKWLEENEGEILEGAVYAFLAIVIIAVIFFSDGLAIPFLEAGEAGETGLAARAGLASLPFLPALQSWKRKQWSG
jgi:hypothetical protein